MTPPDNPLVYDPTNRLSQNERAAASVLAQRLVDKNLTDYLVQREYYKQDLVRNEARALLVARIVSHVASQAHSSANRLTVATMILHDIGSKYAAEANPRLAEPTSTIGQLHGYAAKVWQAGHEYLTKNPAPDTQMTPNLRALAVFYQLAETPDPAPDADAAHANARTRMMDLANQLGQPDKKPED